MADRLGWLASTLTQSANVLGLSPVIVGFVLGRALGLGPACVSILLGGGLTAGLAALSASMAVRHRLPTAQLSERTFGPLGPRLVGGALAIALGGWFGVHALALLQAVPPLLGALAPPPADLEAWRPGVLGLSALLSLLIVWRGNRSIARLNAVQAPLLTAAVGAVTLGRLPCMPWSTLTWTAPHWPSVAMVLAAGLGDIVDMPAILHRSTGRGAATAAAVITYGAVVPGLLLCGVVLAAEPSATSAIDALATGSPAWRLGMASLALGSATLGNAGLLYAGAFSLAAACGHRRVSARWRVAQAALALGLATLPLTRGLGRLLDGLGLATGALGLTMLTTFVWHAPVARASSPRARAQTAAALLAASAGLAVFVAWPDREGLSVAVACSAAVLLCSAVQLLRWRRRSEERSGEGRSER